MMPSASLRLWGWVRGRGVRWGGRGWVGSPYPSLTRDSQSSHRRPQPLSRACFTAHSIATRAPLKHPSPVLSWASRALAKDHGPEPHPEARIRPELTPRTGAARHVRSWSTPARAGPLLPPRSAPLALGVQQRVPVRLAPLLEPSHRLGERPHAHEGSSQQQQQRSCALPRPHQLPHHQAWASKPTRWPTTEAYN